MKFKIDIKPLSVNKAWQGKRFKTKDYKDFEKECLFLMPTKKLKLSDMIRIDFVFGFSSRLSDIDNPIKLCLDILQKKYSFDDKHIFELNIKKKIVSKGKEYIHIEIDNLLPF